MRKLLIIIIVILLLVVLIWQAIYLPKEPNTIKEILFNIRQGTSAAEIAFNLEKQGLVKDDLVFRLYAFLAGDVSKLQAGAYRLSSSMSIPEILRKIVSGETEKDKITIIEGWNLRDIGWYLENKGMFQAEELFELVGFPAVDYPNAPDLPKLRDFSEEYDFLKDKSKNVGLEGYLFPDTYWVSRGEELKGITGRMLDNFNNKLTPDLRETIKNQGKSIFEIVIMASLLEKEVKSFEDRQIVAGVLWKRLKNRMPLQVDATITYVTGKKTTKISKAEMQIDSPYNTYKYRDLPVGPICNPGLDGIKAAVFPKESVYWYYLSTPTGQTIFSRTLEEHNAAKARYLKSS